MLVNIFLDIFMWIRILSKDIIVCILLRNLLVTKVYIMDLLVNTNKYRQISFEAISCYSSPNMH